MILVLVLSLVAGMLIAEYYNRRIQKIMRESWRKAESHRRRNMWEPVVTREDYARMQNGERILKKRNVA